MTEVIKKELYHIHRLGCNSYNWQIGKSISVGSEYNPLYKRVYETQIKFEKQEPGALVNQEMSVVRWLQSQRRPNLTVKEKIDIQRNYRAYSYLNQAAYSLLQLTREIVLEQVREGEFPDKPSRLKGMWFTELTHLKRWEKILTNNNSCPSKIFRIEFTGKLHKGDERWITNENLSVNSYYKNAVGYWQGIPKFKKGKPVEELLGVGNFTIIDEVTC